MTRLSPGQLVQLVLAIGLCSTFILLGAQGAKAEAPQAQAKAELREPDEVIVAGPSDELEYRLVFDLPFSVFGAPGVDTARLDAFPGLGLRGGAWFDVFYDVVVGGEGAFHIARQTQGTPGASFHRNLFLGSGRGLLGYELIDSSTLTFTPYSLIEGAVGPGLIMVAAGSSGRVQPILSWAGRAGLGAMVRVTFLTLRVDVALGVRDLRPDATGTMAFGISF